ncbi:choline uptake/conversion transcriptional regulator CudC [Thalassobacillus hwangdonensis]|uniref:HTH-type transcriptional regulator n=1 Tax=Thalassobacillus hwangdonensis TaxID=546108 RepID=A0ABW3KZS7_9BACI
MSKNPENESHEVIEEAKSYVIDSIAETMDLYGVTRSAGTLYGTMYFEKDMTLNEMRDKLGMSKPSMSTGVKKLQDYDIVKKTFRKGSRRQTYIAEKDFFQFFSNFFSVKWNREVKINTDAIKKAQKRLYNILDANDASDEDKEEARQIIEQLEASKAYYRWLDKLVESIDSGEIFEHFPIDED